MDRTEYKTPPMTGRARWIVERAQGIITKRESLDEIDPEYRNLIMKHVGLERDALERLAQAMAAAPKERRAQLVDKLPGDSGARAWVRNRVKYLLTQRGR